MNDSRRIKITDYRPKVCHVFLTIGCATEINGHFCKKYFYSCVIGRGGGNDPTSECDFE